MALYAPGQLIDRYRLVGLIARGGMGEVWKAWDTELRVDVALKRVNLANPDATEDDWDEAVARAKVEARIGASLRRHPNIVTAFNVVTGVDGVLWLVMDYVEGRSLLERLKADGPVHEDEATKIVGALLEALQAAHTAGITHRDIKPGNVLLGVDGGVFLSDFGIAKRVADTSMTASGMILASLEYAAPERIERTLGNPDGTAADMFSLGVTLYEAIEGISPFRQDPPSFLTTINAICTRPHPPTTKAKRLKPLIDQLLAKKPEDRPGIDEARRLLVGNGQDPTWQSGGPPPPPPPPPPVVLTIRNATDFETPLRVLGTGGAQIGMVPFGTTASITLDRQNVVFRVVVEKGGREWASDVRSIYDYTTAAPMAYVVYQLARTSYPNLALLPEGTQEPVDTRGHRFNGKQAKAAAMIVGGLAGTAIAVGYGRSYAEQQAAIQKQQQAKIAATVVGVLAVLAIAIALAVGYGGYQDVRDAAAGDCVSVSKADSNSWHKVECWWHASWNSQSAVFKVTSVYTSIGANAYACGNLDHTFVASKNSSAVHLLCLNEISAG